MEIKICTSCDEEKSLEEFPKNSKGKLGRASVCKPCSAKRSDEYRKINPIKRLAKKYNMKFLDEAARIFQADECEICKRTSTETKLVVDHNHETGEVRGKLCDTCNKGLGQFYDNQNLLLEAALYIRKYNK